MSISPLTSALAPPPLPLPTRGRGEWILGRPNQTHPAFFRRLREFCVEEGRVHRGLQGHGQVRLYVLAGVALVVLMDQDVRGAEELGLRPLFVAGQTLGDIAGAGQKQRRPAAPTWAWTREAINGRRRTELLMRTMHAEAMQAA